VSNSSGLATKRKRFDSVFNTFETKINELNSRQLFGIWGEEFTTLLKDILQSFKIDLKDNVLASTDEDIENILPTLNHRIDSLTSLLEITLNTLCKNSSVHEFVSWILRDMEVAKDTPYLLCVRQSLETVAIITSCKLYFKGPLYPNINETINKYQEKFPDFSIIFIPPSVIENKKYWSLILHEIGHILNDRYLLTEEFNERVEQPSPFNDKFRNYYHGREFISDYIANLYCGPVFYDSLNEYLGEMDVIPKDWEYTHPFRDARLFFLEDVLGDIVGNPKIINTKPARDNYELVENLDKMISKTKEIIFENEAVKYHENLQELTKSTAELKTLTPYVGSPRILLNGYSKNFQDILSSIKKETNQDNLEIINNIGRIIEDSIRLTNMKRTFDIME